MHWQSSYRFWTSVYNSLPACVVLLPYLFLSDEPEEFTDLSNVQLEYLDLEEVFNKHCATALPPHRAYDCATELLPGTSPPHVRLYSLKGPEQHAMDKDISGSLNPSSSPASSLIRQTRTQEVFISTC